MARKIKFELIENCKDSLEHAVVHLTQAPQLQPSDLKRAILDLTHVVELLLKEKLRRAHPAFIWEDIDQYPDESKRTVSTELAFQRLVKMAGIGFSDEFEKTIKASRRLRNSIEHYKFTFEEKEADVVIGRLLSFVFQFSKDQLGLDWESEYRKDHRWQGLIGYYDFWKAHKPVVEKKMVHEGLDVIPCPECNAVTFDLKEGKCDLCLHKEEVFECERCGSKLPESDFTFGRDGEYEDEPYLCDNCVQHLLED